MENGKSQRTQLCTTCTVNEMLELEAGKTPVPALRALQWRTLALCQCADVHLLMDCKWGWMLQSNQKNLVPIIRWCFVTDSSVPAHACLTVCLRYYLVNGEYVRSNHQWCHQYPGFTGEPATFDHQVQANSTSQEATGIGHFCLYLNTLGIDAWKLLTDLCILYNRQHG